MAPAGGIWAPIAMRTFKHAFKKVSNLIKVRLSRPLLHAELDPILARTSPKQPIHPVANLRQIRSRRWYITHSTINATVHRFLSTTTRDSVKHNRPTFPSSATATAVSRLTIRAPWNSTLRPNLSAGAFPRTAGGSSLGGGARYFSHTALPGQVVNNVSVAVRAFWLSGQKAQFDGLNTRGEKQYRTISILQERTGRTMQSLPKNTPGSFIDFSIIPTVTALTPLGAAFGLGPLERSVPTLNTEGFLDVLSVDFARALKDLAVTLNDLKSLSTLGDLPISLENKNTLRVSFPGCDAETVERLCEEVGVQRGVIYQDEDFDSQSGSKMALMFPFAPATEYALSSPGGLIRSQSGHYFEEMDDVVENPWMDGYESASAGESASFIKPSEHQIISDYEGLEGIYRFLEQCDGARRIQ